MDKSVWAVGLATLLSLLAVACGGGTPRTTSPAADAPPEIGAVFREYYRSHDGERVFGPAVSIDIVTAESAHRQYFQNAILDYNPGAPAAQRVTPASLGAQYHPRESPASATLAPGAVCFAQSGHCVNFAFGDFFNQHGGVPTFGYPVSEIHLEDGRLAQHFERASFYWDETLPPGQRVQLAPLGWIECQRVNCPSTGSRFMAIAAGPPKVPASPPDQAFLAFASAHGGRDVFGLPLRAPQLGPDGAIEHVYENAVIYQDPTAPLEIHLRPLGLYHRPADPPATPIPEPGVIYDATYGHNLAWGFREFYEQYGGAAVFGHPTSEVMLEGDLLVQCFENARLEWDAGAPEGQKMRLSPLGLLLETKELESLATSPGLSPRELQVWPEWPVLLVGQPQTIYARLFDAAGHGLPDVETLLVVQAPGGDRVYLMPSTDANGRTAVTFRLSAPKAGEFVSYEVAARVGDQTAVAQGEFIVWYGSALNP